MCFAVVISDGKEGDFLRARKQQALPVAILERSERNDEMG